MKILILVTFVLLGFISNGQNTKDNLLCYNSNNDISYNLNMSVPNDIIKHNYNLNILPKKSRGYGFGSELAIGLLAAGSAFIMGGISTNIPYNGYNGKNKSFFKQGPRMYAIIGGTILLTTGFVISIGI